MKDQDLDILLAEYRNIKPTDLQIQKWKTNVRKGFTGVTSPKKIWASLIAASMIGFVIGALLFGLNKKIPPQELAENNNATIEYVYINNH